MKKTESREIAEQFLYVYAGILFENKEFEEGNSDEVVYRFDCPEFITLKEKYDLEKIAGQGSEFARAKRLLRHFAPRLRHSPWYDGHVPCNALSLLEYSLDNPEQGINCATKSKILEECCLALGIYARRVCLMPFSPYDFDNHVVTEIYDKTLQKWIMLDPTTDGFFIDENKTPLSVLEIRRNFAADEFVTFVSSAARLTDLRRLQAKNVEENTYICKNSFCFAVDRESTFGVGDGNSLYCIPKNFSLKDNAIANTTFRIHRLPSEYADRKPYFEQRLEQLKGQDEPARTSIRSFEKSPE